MQNYFSPKGANSFCSLGGNLVIYMFANCANLTKIKSSYDSPDSGTHARRDYAKHADGCGPSASVSLMWSKGGGGWGS